MRSVFQISFLKVKHASQLEYLIRAVVRRTGTQIIDKLLGQSEETL